MLHIANTTLILLGLCCVVEQWLRKTGWFNARLYTAKFMEEEQELLSDLAGYHDAEQLTALNITKKSHVKKLLKQARKQREKLGLPERAEEDTMQDGRPDGVPADAVNIMEDIQRREAEKKAQENADIPANACKDSTDYVTRQEKLEEATHRATALHVEAERIRAVRNTTALQGLLGAFRQMLV